MGWVLFLGPGSLELPNCRSLVGLLLMTEALQGLNNLSTFHLAPTNFGGCLFSIFGSWVPTLKKLFGPDRPGLAFVSFVLQSRVASAPSRSSPVATSRNLLRSLWFPGWRKATERKKRGLSRSPDAGTVCLNPSKRAEAGTGRCSARSSVDLVVSW